MEKIVQLKDHFHKEEILFNTIENTSVEFLQVKVASYVGLLKDTEIIVKE